MGDETEAAMIDSWWDKFITYEGRNEDGDKIYIVWDECQAYDIGTYQTYDEAVIACLEYAKHLNSKEPKDTNTC